MKTTLLLPDRLTPESANAPRLAGLLEATVERPSWLQPDCDCGQLSPILSLNGRGGNVLDFYEQDIPGVGTFRCTEIRGPRVEVFNTMIFPANADALPVFASEIVIFSNELRVGVIDLQPLHNSIRERHLVRELMEPLRARYTEVPRVEKMPDWCDSHFTDMAIFARGDGLSMIQALCNAYEDYLDLFATMGEASVAKSPRKTSRFLREYKDHHIKHSPGKNFLSKVFGTEWTLDFLMNRMYA